MTTEQQETGNSFPSHDVESWSPIPKYEGLYEVSTFGRFRNRYGKILKQNLIKKGYYHITLYRNGIPKTYKSHRLVGMVYVHNPLNLPEINHKFGVKTDNRPSQLEWNTRAQNNRHAIETGLLVLFKKGEGYFLGKRGGETPRAKIVLDLRTGIFYECAKDAALAKNVSYNQLKNRLQGKTFNNLDLKYV